MRDEPRAATRQGSDALDALKARRAAAAARRPLPRAPRSATPRRRWATPAAFALLLIWAATATYLAIDDRRAVLRLVEEQAASRVANEERVRALTRRLVGVASHQALEQDGLAERLADIITRQVELENRQSTLSLMVDRLPGGGAVAPGRGGALEPAGPPRSRLAETLARSPLRDQFARLEGSLARIGDAQTATLARFATAIRGRVETVRGVVAELGLKIAPEPRAAPAPVPEPRGASTAVRSDPFPLELARLATVIQDGERWSSLSDGLPLKVPLVIEGNTTSNFGTRKDPFTGAATMHPGMDFRSPIGTPARATATGRVVSADVRGGYGNMVEVDHGHDLTTRYAHLSTIQVQVGQTVGPGTVVGLVGSTGRSTGPHLHYETRVAGAPVDPARFIQAGSRLAGQPAQALTPSSPGDAATDVEDGSGD